MSISMKTEEEFHAAANRSYEHISKTQRLWKLTWLQFGHRIKYIVEEFIDKKKNSSFEPNGSERGSN